MSNSMQVRATKRRRVTRGMVKTWHARSPSFYASMHDDDAISAAKTASQFPSSERAKKTWEAIAEVWPEEKNDHFECLEGVLLADSYYNYYRPERQVELLVLSESHAFTSAEALSCRLKSQYRSNDAPENHLRLVHSLSYGEPSLLLGQDRNNVGTPAFWRLLDVLAGNDNARLSLSASKEEYKGGFSHLSQSNCDARLKTKKDILKRIQGRGIMFADVCPVPVYLGADTVECTNKITGHRYTTNMNKLPSKVMKEIIVLGWNLYAAPLILEIKPKRLILLGKGIEHRVGREKIEALCHSVGTQLLLTFFHPSYNRVSGYNYRGFLGALRAHAEGNDALANELHEQAKQDLLERERSKKKQQLKQAEA